MARQNKTKLEEDELMLMDPVSGQKLKKIKKLEIFLLTILVLLLFLFLYMMLIY